jgi:hypothetical protein
VAFRIDFGGIRNDFLGWVWVAGFFIGFAGKTKMATGGWPDLSSLAVGVDRGHPQWPDLSLFFFLSFAGKVAGDDGGSTASVRRRWAMGDGGQRV